ncbi:RNA-binding region RNP-1 domain-containing protein [Heterostelium album PN500]|uniref:Polyadenylate-binding protein n=1 Tax=Heterostelium pallidum (strain ATCC 26659 / Pp 5 / PN500) TaxID=670386 RepID=D3AVQ3_HETP5|nr:RNA-binding region RNP-1 domain-containing protein [Heterostelium album PN500]EFA86376.1 RNA-binding region RNP-1 domain-containing protein [Heterostelium album PN500]|eukprot:XP_020438481.1 RNA-binding region RNP-1 domain-containing protein [Heterostelium album PN500]
MTTTFSSSSLYVGDLHPDVSESHLFEVFNQVGPVANLRICRDNTTRRSLSYAYINYHNSTDAERALDTLNNTPIKGKACRIMWSQRDPSLRKSGIGNIFIKNLDKTVDHKALYDTFSAFGNILSCKVVTDETNTSKGFGFVHYESQESAEKAIAKVNGMMINNQKVFVGPFKSSKERGATQEVKYTNVFIKNLSEDVSEQQLTDLLQAHGKITNLCIMTDEKGKSKGFGFANFEHADAAKGAVENENGKMFSGKVIYVGRAQKKLEREAELKHKFETKYQGVNLYIKNLDDSIDSDKLRATFSAYGTITSSKVMRDDKGSSSKGFGFVCYSTPDEASKAVAEMHGRMVGSKPLYVAFAQRKDVRRAQLEAQHTKFKSSRMPVQSIYPPTGPIFYPPAGMPVVYPQMIPRPPRAGWNGPVPQQGQYPPMQGQYPIRNPRGGVPPTGNHRNQPRPRPDGQQPAAQQPIAQQLIAEPQAVQPEVTLATVQSMPREQQNSFLGELLYPLIHASQPDLSGKITGMLLDSLTVEELFTLYQRTELLADKIKEALDVLTNNTNETPEQQ